MISPDEAEENVKRFCDDCIDRDIDFITYELGHISELIEAASLKGLREIDYVIERAIPIPEPTFKYITEEVRKSGYQVIEFENNTIKVDWWHCRNW
jgi:hypothetical protein